MPSKTGRNKELGSFGSDSSGKKAEYYPVRPLATQPLLTIENLKSRIPGRNAKILPPKYAAPDYGIGYGGASSRGRACERLPPQCCPPQCCPPQCCPPQCSPQCCPPQCCPPQCCPPQCCPPMNCYPPMGCCPPPQSMCSPYPLPLCYPPPCPPVFCCPQPQPCYCPYPCMPPPNCCPPPPCPPPPCKVPCCDPCKPPGSKCCGAGATLVCVPKGCKPGQNCKSRDGNGGECPQRSELPPSYNNCNFYVSELPKGLDPKNLTGPKASCQQDNCEDFYDTGSQEMMNYPAGDGKVVPPPVGYPGSQRTTWGGAERASVNGNPSLQDSHKSKLSWGNDDVPINSQQLPKQQTNIYMRDNDGDNQGRSQGQVTFASRPNSDHYSNRSAAQSMRSRPSPAVSLSAITHQSGSAPVTITATAITNPGDYVDEDPRTPSAWSNNDHPPTDYENVMSKSNTSQRSGPVGTPGTQSVWRNPTDYENGLSKSNTSNRSGGNKNTRPPSQIQLSRSRSKSNTAQRSGVSNSNRLPQSEYDKSPSTFKSGGPSSGIIPSNNGEMGFIANIDSSTGELAVQKVGSGGTLSTQKFETPEGGIGTTISYTTGGAGGSRSMTNVSRRDDFDVGGTGGSRSMTNLSGNPNGAISETALSKLAPFQNSGGTILKVIKPNEDSSKLRFQGEGGGGTPLQTSVYQTKTILPPPARHPDPNGRFWLPQTPEMCKPKKRKRPHFVPLCKTCLQNYKGAPEFDDCGLPAPQPKSRGGGFLHGRSGTPSRHYYSRGRTDTNKNLSPSPAARQRKQ